jgi:large conductance mechanosensitive channel
MERQNGFDFKFMSEVWSLPEPLRNDKDGVTQRLIAKVWHSEEESMYGEFKTFIMRGNVVDLAVGVVIGAAFGKIVTSFVEDVLMPPIGLALGKVDFSNLFINLSGKDYPSVTSAKQAGAATLNYGIFFNNIINFLIIAFVIFLLIKQINRMQEPAPAAEPTAKDCPYCLSSVPLKATKCAFCASELK